MELGIVPSPCIRNKVLVPALTELPYLTRIIPPDRRGHVIRRDRLITFIKNSLSKKAQVLWAPAGYGKTALLAEMVFNLDVPVCWYSFAPEDNDPLSLLRYCLHSMRTRFPDFGVAYRSLATNGHLADRNSQCGFLVNALQSDIDRKVAFVFDDLHWIEGKLELQETLSLLIERAPAKIHFILASRVWPSLSCLPKLAASDELSSLDVHAFRFSTDETVQLLANLWKHPVPSERAEAVNKRTGGWAAGILLTAKSPAALDSDTGETGDPGLLFDYLSAEVFDKLPSSLQSFLLRTSILRQFTAALCDELLELSSSQAIIDQIKDRSLFLEEHAGRNTTYSYHDLFRGYLQRRFKTEWSEEYKQTTLGAAALYRELGDDDAAIYHYLQVGEADEVVKIIKQTSGSNFDQRSWPKLASWLDGLPAHVLESDSELLLLSGQILTNRAGDSTGALKRFEKLLAGNNANGREIRGRALVAQSTAYRRLGHLDLAVKAAQDGLAVLLEAECPPDHIAEAHRQLASALATKGELELGKRHFKAALEIARKDNLSLISLICDGLAVACIELGELDQAALYLEQARAGWLKLGTKGPLAESLVNMALVYYHQGEFDLAFDEATEALRAAEAAGYPRLVATALSRLATVQQALGAYEDSLASSSRALEMARDLLDHRLVAESTQDVGNAYRKLGESSKAAVLLNQALLEAEQSGQKYVAAYYHLPLGKVYFQEGFYDQASNHFTMAEELLGELNSMRRVAEAKLYQAAICYRKGKLSETLEYLVQVSCNISELGYDGFLLADGDEVLDVLRFGAARRVGGDIYIRLVARLTHIPLSDQESESPVARQNGFARLPALRAFAFGAPRVALDSHEVSDLEWRSRKAKELFFYLLCNKRQLNKEELMEALWPETSVKMSESALRTNIYRLRQAVFYECVSARDAGYGINPAVTCQFDIDEFQKHLRLATEAGRSSGERTEHLRNAIALYDGPFLNGFYSEWCQRLRTDLELKFHEALMNLAEYHALRGDFFQSAELLEKVVESDPYNDEAQFRLVENMIAANEPLAALQRLRGYAKLCREELGQQLPQRFAHCHNRILNHLPRSPAAVA